MRASLIVITINRSEALRLLLEELAWQEGSDFEVVVVVGPTEDDTLPVLEPLTPFIKLVRTPLANISLARNIGAEAAAGEVLVFIDDDAYPADRDWVQRYLQVFTAQECPPGITGGEVLVRNTPWFEFKGGLFSRLGFQVFDESNVGSEPDKGWIPRVAGGNNACLKSVFQSLGGYDESYAYYLDETDFCSRLHDQGLGIQIIGNPIRHYRYPSSIRRSDTLLNRFPIARSDFYFCIKNSLLPGCIAMLQAWYVLPRKHYFKEVFQKVDGKPVLTFLQRLDTLCTLFAGAFVGSCIGFRRRRLRNQWSKPAAFKVFDRERVLKISQEHFPFRNNPMSESSSSHQAGVRETHFFQCYWATLNHGFEEESSLRVAFPGGRICVLTLEIPVSEPIVQLRIDPSDKVCDITHLSCRLHNEKTGSSWAWEWNGKDRIPDSSDLVVGDGGPNHPMVLRSLSEDPWMYWNLPVSASALGTLTVVIRVR